MISDMSCTVRGTAQGFPEQMLGAWHASAPTDAVHSVHIIERMQRIAIRLGETIERAFESKDDLSEEPAV